MNPFSYQKPELSPKQYELQRELERRKIEQEYVRKAATPEARAARKRATENELAKLAAADNEAAKSPEQKQDEALMRSIKKSIEYSSEETAAVPRPVADEVTSGFTSTTTFRRREREPGRKRAA